MTSTENRAHIEIAELMQRIWDRDRIRVTTVEVLWFDTSTTSDRRFIINGVTLKTDSFGARK